MSPRAAFLALLRFAAFLALLRFAAFLELLRFLLTASLFGPKLFRRGDALVRLDHVPDPRDREPRFKLMSINEAILTNELTRQDTGLAFYTVAKQPVVVPPPSALVRNMMSERPKAIPLPTISRIVHAPIVAEDGTITTTKGYHEKTGTFYVEGSLKDLLAPLPEKPTAADVARAVEQLLAPLADFPFREEASRTHALAFMLLPFVRDIIHGPTPLHLITKPQAGVGATLLTDAIFAPSAGENIARMSQAQNDEEWEKVLTATFLEGASIVQLDNVTELVSGKLAKAITDSVWKGRILGQSRNMEARVTCVFGATGINPRISTEIARRIIPINLVPVSSLPWLRDRSEFKIPNLTQWLFSHRSEMVHAALTLIRAWFVAGAPRRTDVRLGMFEEYVEIMGGILRLAGREDFLGNLMNLYEDNDAEGGALTWFAEEWLAKHGDANVLQSEVALWATEAGTPVAAHLNASGNLSSASRFAHWLRSLRDRHVSVTDGAVAFRVEKDAKRASRTYWRVVRLDGQAVAATEAVSDF